MTQTNTFETLSKIDVSSKLEKKGRFHYLSWPYAVSELRKHYPKATWDVRRFDGLPYLKTDIGCFVEVAVTVDEITLSQIHPVLDNRNRPIQKPNSFDINTSIQRCLVKAIALHGLGINVFAGEDLPNDSVIKRETLDKEKANQLAKRKLASTLESIASCGDAKAICVRFDEMTKEEKELLGDNLESSKEYYIRKSNEVTCQPGENI